MSDIDVLLYRPIKDGKQFDKLIPPSNCTKTYAGKGMTDFSVKEMAEMVKISLIDTAAIAPLFKQRSLQLTCAEIHEFAYNYFQYKADGAKQFLRSPACSWKMRYDGIDCKSYSIIASSILMNLRLTHYIRQVKQPGYKPDMWTHVYVVVPVDQKTGSLSQGHYTIDGTIAMLDEPMYIQKSDLKMSMEHYALRGAMPQQPQEGLAISFGDVKKFFASGWSPSCIGGTHDMRDFEGTIAEITPWFDDIIYSINDGIRNNKPVFDLVNTLLLNTQQIKAQSAHYAEYKWSSKCSKDATKAYAAYGLWYYNMIFQAFMPWLEQYFNITYKTVAGIKMGGFIPDSKFLKTSFNGGTIEVKQMASMTIKSNISEIKKFEFTPYAMGAKEMILISFSLFPVLLQPLQALAVLQAVQLQQIPL